MTAPTAPVDDAKTGVPGLDDLRRECEAGADLPLIVEEVLREEAPSGPRPA